MVRSDVNVEDRRAFRFDDPANVVGDLGLSPARLERLVTAVSEATMNAIEYGSQGSADVPVDVVIETTAEAIVIRITDRALSGPVPGDLEPPDLELKLAGLQKPRGWGLFLIKEMVDAMDVTSDGSTQTVSLTMARKEPGNG